MNVFTNIGKPIDSGDRSVIEEYLDISGQTTAKGKKTLN